MKIETGAGANVTSLIPYLTQSANPVLTEMLGYWERLRAGRIAPLRSEVDPREIEGVLEHAFILEQSGDEVPRFRIAGMKLCDLMGMEIRSMPATTLISPNCRSQFVRLLQVLFSKPEILELKLESLTHNTGPLTGEMLLLPMQASPGEVTRILGCLVTSGQAAKTPARFEIRAQKHTRIIAASHSPAQGVTTGFAEPTTPFIPRPSLRKTIADKPPRDYLRLVKSDGQQAKPPA